MRHHARVAQLAERWLEGSRPQATHDTHVAQRTWTDDDLAKSVARSATWSEVVSDLGLSVAGSTLERVRRRAEDLKLTLVHLDRNHERHPLLVQPGPLRALLLTSTSVRDALRQAGLPATQGQFERLGRAVERHRLQKEYAALAERGRLTNRRKTSRIWDVTVLAEAAEGAPSMTVLVDRLGLSSSSAENRRRVRIALAALGLDAPPSSPPITSAEREQAKRWLTEAAPTQATIKKTVIRAGLLEERCHAPGCSVTSSWVGRPIVLHLDHIDGNRLNNHLSNLRLLCPNCHSQTGTYCGRNNQRGALAETD